MNMVFNHRLSRTRGANACAGRAVAPLPPRGRGTRPACPQWLVAICAFFAFTLTAPAADPTISISARQRYPWNGLVDLNFTITGTSGTKYDTSFTAKDIVGNTNITMATIRKADGSAANKAAFEAAFREMREYRASIEGDDIANFDVHARKEAWGIGWPHEAAAPADR